MNTVSWGMLQVKTAHERKYIMRQSLMVLMAGRPGEKNIPSLWTQVESHSRENEQALAAYQTIPWLLTRCRMFSAIGKSVYPGKDSRSQKKHAFPLMYLCPAEQDFSIRAFMSRLSLASSTERHFHSLTLFTESASPLAPEVRVHEARQSS